MQVKIEKQPKSVMKITVTVELDKVKQAYEKAVEEAVKKTQIDGFRLGNAPRNMVEQKVGVSTLYGEVINDLLQTYYPQALKENLIMPISNPRVEVKEFDLGKDFEFVATVAVRPEIRVGDFRKRIKESFLLRTEAKKRDNEQNLKEGKPLNTDPIKASTNEILDAIVKETKVEIADVLIEEEVNRMMSRLLDQAQTIGLSLEEYLRAQKKTAEQLRKEYSEIAERSLIAELGLAEIIKNENIEVSDQDIDDAAKASGVPDVEKQIQNPMERLYVKTILQKSKLLTRLGEEVENSVSKSDS